MISHIKHYIELARLDKPAGWLLLMWPCWFGVILAGSSFSINYYFLFIFAIGSVCMRGAGCVVNDIVDRKIDAQVERTKNRPLASGVLSVKQGFGLLAALLFVGLIIFLQLNLNAQLIALAAACLAVIYPFMKRIFGYPQLFLGIVFNSGALVAWSAVSGSVEWPAFALYAGGIFWTLAYDTIYGHQDKKDDAVIGVRSTALSFGKYNRAIIMACYIAFYVLVCISAQSYGIGSVWLLCAPALIYTIYTTLKVKFDDAADCAEKFRDNAFITGFLYFAGLYIAKILG